MKLITCNSNKPLAESIANQLGIKLCDATIKTFSDNEIIVEINENIRGEDVYIIQSTSDPVNDNIILWETKKVDNMEKEESNK